MPFNSLEFVIFLPVVFLLYWFVTHKHLQLQNIMLLTASYVFYAWWDYRFLTLIIFSSTVDYFCGIVIHQQSNERKRKLLLYLSLGINLGILGVFKYFNFFLDSFVKAFNSVGMELEYSTLHIILPVGISFYTFQTLSYTIDIYRKKLTPTRDVIGFFTFVAFFPQLVAGPIERAKDLLPQLTTRRTFSYKQATDGLRQITWGFFQKLVVADNIGAIINSYFNDPESYSGLTLAVAISCFSIQIYADWAGYSNIAIGIAKLLGIRLSPNFKYPYFSRNFSEFWNRWHISLMHWFRDYVYFPLGGSRAGPVKTTRNTLIIFLICGIWHGADWNYIISFVGLGVILLISRIFFKHRSEESDVENKLIPDLKHVLGMFFIFVSISFSMIFFRILDFSSSISFITGIFDDSYLTGVHQLKRPFIFICICTFLLFITEWVQRHKEHALDIAHLKPGLRWVIYIVIILFIIKYGYFKETDFIYFQF